MSRSLRVGPRGTSATPESAANDEEAKGEGGKAASCFVFDSCAANEAKGSSGAVHGNTPANHGIECVLLRQRPVQRFPMLPFQSCLPLFACFGPTRLSFLNVHNRTKRFGWTKEPETKQRVDLFCVMLGMVEEAEKLRARAKHCRDLAATAMDPAVEDVLLVMAEEFEEAAAELEVRREDSEGYIA